MKQVLTLLFIPGIYLFGLAPVQKNTVLKRLFYFQIHLVW